MWNSASAKAPSALPGPGANAIDYPAVVPGDDNLMVVGIADQQAIRQGENFARKLQPGLGDAFRLELHLKRRAIDFTALVEHANHGLDGLLEAVVVAFAGGRPHHVAGGIDDHARRPGVHGIGAPDPELGVVGDGMPDLVARMICRMFSVAFSLSNFAA